MSDKIIIEALPQRFEQLSLGLSLKKQQEEIDVKDLLVGVDALNNARKEFLGYVEMLAALPPPEEELDDIGFSAATNTPMRNWLFNEYEGLNTYTNLYSAIQVMKIHKGQLPQGRLEAIEKIVKPYAEKESKQFGLDISSKKIQKGTEKYKGKDYEKLSPIEKTDVQIHFDPIIMEWVESLKFTQAGLELHSRQKLSIALTRLGKVTRLIQTKKDGDNFYHVIDWKNFNLPNLQEIAKQITHKKQLYPVMNRLWELIMPILPMILKKIESKEEEIQKEEENLPTEDRLLRLLERSNIGIRDIFIDGDNLFVFSEKNGYYLSKQVADDANYKVQKPFAKKISNYWYTGIPLHTIPQYIAQLRYKNANNYADFFQKVWDIIEPSLSKIQQEEIEKQEEAVKVEKKTWEKLEDSSLQKEGKELLLGMSRYYETLPKYDAGMYAAIVDIAKVIEAEPNIDDVIGISLVPSTADIEWEKKNYFSSSSSIPKDKTVIVIPVPKDQVSKVMIGVDNNKAFIDLHINDRETSMSLKGKNRPQGKWYINREAIIDNQWHKISATKDLMNDWAIKLEKKYPLLSFAIRKWIDTNKDVLGKDCDPKLASLWGKGYYDDIEDKNLVHEIKKAIPEDFEAEGLIPSKKLGGKPQKVMFKPYEYQKIGAYFAYKLKRAYIGDTMGLGKTIQGLLWLRLLSNGNDAYPALICCPASVVYNWVDEVERWLPNVSVSAYDDNEKTQIRVISWGSLSLKEAKIIQAKYKSFIVDEAHYGKNGYAKPAPKRATSFMKIANEIPNVLLLSGTPMENRVDELWSQIYALKPDAYPTFRDFEISYSPKKQVSVKTGGREISIMIQDDEALKKYKEQKGESLFYKLNREMRCLMIRRLKSDVQDTLQLPEKERIYIDADVGTQGRQIYAAQQENIRKIIGLALKRRIMKMLQKDIVGGIPIHEAIELAKDYVRENVNIDNIEETGIAVFGYLRRATADAKIPVATQWIKDFITKEKKPILIWADHGKVIRNMSKALDDINVKYGVIDGSVNKKARNEIVKAFQNGDLDAVVLSKAGREGLTLTRASDALFVERWLVPTWEEQAEDRIYRIGQKDKVNIYYLMMRDTTDDDISEMIDKKRKAIEEAVGLEKIESAEGGEAKIEDEIIKNVAAKLIQRIRSELQDKPLTEAELIPTEEEVKDFLIKEQNLTQDFVRFFPVIDYTTKIIKKIKPPSRSEDLKNLYDSISDGDDYYEIQKKDDLVTNLLKNKKISTIDKIIKIPILKASFGEPYDNLIDTASENNFEISLATMKKFLSKQQIDRMIEKNICEIVSKPLEI